MIKTLRRKLILINMSLASLVLIVVFAVIAVNTYSGAISDSRGSLMRVLDQRAGIAQVKPQIAPRISQGNAASQSDAPTSTNAKPKYSDAAAQARANIHVTATFSVLMSPSGRMIDTDTSEVTIADETVAEAARIAYEAGENDGVISEYSLRYKMRREGDCTRIAFVDLERENATMSMFFTVSLFIGAAAFPALFLISLLLSNLAVKPVKVAWEREKQFVADASHELKTPLTVILANTDILLKQKLAPNQAKWVESTHDEGLMMKSLVEDMLFLAKADAEDKPYIMEQVQLSDAVWNTSLQFESVAFERGINIVSSIADNIVTLTNLKAVKQILAILLDNALKHAPSNTDITLSLSQRHDLAVISVKNYGEPIPPAALAHVFERFYRSDSARSRDEGGFGLGLSIAKRISQRLFATLQAQSSEKEGTAFTLSIPIKRA